MTKWTFIFFLLLGAALSQITFENLDIEKLLSNESQRKAALACLLDQKPCGELQGLKDSVPQLISTKCGQCNPKVKEKYEYISKILFEKYPEDFNALFMKYSITNN